MQTPELWPYFPERPVCGNTVPFFSHRCHCPGLEETVGIPTSIHRLTLMITEVSIENLLRARTIALGNFLLLRVMLWVNYKTGVFKGVFINVIRYISFLTKYPHTKKLSLACPSEIQSGIVMIFY